MTRIFINGVAQNAKEFELGRPSSFKKKHARHLKKFSASADTLVIDRSAFGLEETATISIARNKKAYKTALRSDHSFVFYRKKGWIVFNENGDRPGKGQGGLIARLPRKTKLKASQVRFVDGQSEEDPSTTSDPGTSTDPGTTADPSTTTDPSDATGPGIDLTSTTASSAGSTGFDPANKTLFRGGPQRPERLEKLVSGSIDTAREVDRFAISAVAGSVVSLSVAADPGTWPQVRLVDADGRELAESSAYNKSTASTSGWLSDGRDLFAEVYAQQSFTGSYDLTATVWETQQPLLDIPDALNILLDNTSLSSGDRYSSRYLYADDGLIYVSFGDGITAELQRWWEDVLASTDAIIEPEFVVVPLSHPKSQLTLNQISASSVSGGAGHYQAPPYLYSKLSDGSRYDYRRTEPQGELILAEGVYSHASRYANSREAGWKSAAFHELGHALGLEHPHEYSDGDGDDVIDTNGTVMSYVKKQDADGDPGFTTLDIQALQFIYGRESGRTTRRRSRDHRW